MFARLSRQSSRTLIEAGQFAALCHRAAGLRTDLQEGCGLPDGRDLVGTGHRSGVSPQRRAQQEIPKRANAYNR